jgi:hypothetical protein
MPVNVSTLVVGTVLLCLCVLVGLAQPPAARAQEPPPGPVGIQGGGSAETAPVLTPGTYRDTLLARDELWYGLDLQPGQTPSATLRVVGGSAAGLTPFAQLQFELRSDDVLGDLRCDIATARELAGDDGQVAVAQGAVEVRGPQIVQGDALCRQPGRYYLRLALLDRARRAVEQAVPVPAALDVELTLDIQGAPAQEPAAPGDGAATGGGQRSAATRPANLEEPDMGAVVLAFAVLGFGIAGFATGTAAGKRLLNAR